MVGVIALWVLRRCSSDVGDWFKEMDDKRRGEIVHANGIQLVMAQVGVSFGSRHWIYRDHTLCRIACRRQFDTFHFSTSP
jgi:hypothetical protein